MRYLVTGGAGFIGSHCCDALLAAGDDVTVLDNFSTGKRANIAKGITIVEGDCADTTLMRKIMPQMDGVFHLAAVASVEKSRTAWAKTTRTNLIGTVSVFDAIADCDTPIPCVYASSAAVYGDAQTTPITEDTPPHPLAAYGVDKYASELHAHVGARLHAIPSTGLRFFNVYGPRQDPSSPYSGVISIFASRLLHDQPITINGDGSYSRDFIYVSTVVKYLLAAMQRHHQRDIAESGIYNICTGEATTIKQLANLLISLTRSNRTPVYGPVRAADIAHSVGTATKAQTAFGLRSATSLEAGLRHTLKWMQAT